MDDSAPAAGLLIKPVVPRLRIRPYRSFAAEMQLFKEILDASNGAFNLQTRVLPASAAFAASIPDYEPLVIWQCAHDRNQSPQCSQPTVVSGPGNAPI
jgi:hypothetical protein